jgi:hypothetical protein
MSGLGALVPKIKRKGNNMSKLPRVYTGFLLGFMCSALLVLAAVGVHRFVNFSDANMNWYVSFGFIVALVGAIVFQLVTYLQITKKD